VRLLKTTLLIILCFGIITPSLYSQQKQRNFLSYQDLRSYQQASPGAFKFGLYGFDNPALLTYLKGMDMMYSMDIANKNLENFNNFGFFTGTHGLGFGMIQSVVGNNVIDEYRLTTGFGDRSFSLGMGYGWSNGATEFFNRKDVFMLGALIRPSRALSLGLSYTVAFGGVDAQYTAEMAIRPIKDVLLTVFGDIALFNRQNLEKADWSAGLSYEVLDGVRLSGRYFSDESVSVGFDFSLGESGYGIVSTIDKNGDGMKNSHSNIFIRSGALDRSLFNDFSSKRNYLCMNLTGGIKYQRGKIFGMFTEETNTLVEILDVLENAKNNENIGGVVLNVSQLAANKEMLWEIREKLLEIKTKGKKVVIFFESAGIDLYHLASVADNIVMDNLGSIALWGYTMGGSYYKKMLDEVGIGVEELRYFKYKSAAESLVREGMSDADREQRQAIIDDWYQNSKSEICASRGFTPEQFEGFVNDQIGFMPSEAVEKKLVDKLGRWNNVEKIMKEIDPEYGQMVGSWRINPAREPIDDKWGEPDKIAIIYAVGVCAMDEGIKARELVYYVKAAAENPKIRAIVLRVDSPGGDPMASEYIAEVVREYRNRKPIIISQGYVAASGGYWLSMDGSKVVASPITITGSIGVIGTWMYDKGLMKDIGISTDNVKVGKYADLGFPFSLPLIGLGLPVRNLNDDEKAQLEQKIRQMYKDFVTKVSEGRKKTFEEIEKIAQGRVWSGQDALSLGLVDEIGGLYYALDMAKREAGFAKDEEINIVQYPSPEKLGMEALLPGLIGVDIKKIDENIEFLKFLINNNGLPMPLMPLDMVDTSTK